MWTERLIFKITSPFILVILWISVTSSASSNEPKIKNPSAAETKSVSYKSLWVDLQALLPGKSLNIFEF